MRSLSTLTRNPAATPQRFTWVYPITFSSADGFTQPTLDVTLNASIATVSGSAQLQLVQQETPYATDGATSWLSTHLREFFVKQGQSKFNVPLNGSTPTDAINSSRTFSRRGLFPVQRVGGEYESAVLRGLHRQNFLLFCSQVSCSAITLVITSRRVIAVAPPTCRSIFCIERLYSGGHV